jgi:hypothetical protein
LSVVGEGEMPEHGRHAARTDGALVELVARRCDARECAAEQQGEQARVD